MFFVDCKAQYLNASTFWGVLAILDSPERDASTSEPVYINISTHFKMYGNQGQRCVAEIEQLLTTFAKRDKR